MKLKYLVGFIVLSGCDPTYQYAIKANDSDVYLQIFPSLEEKYCKQASESCDYVKRHKVVLPNGTEVYFIRQGEALALLGGIGGNASLNSFPFDSAYIFRRADTVRIIGKKELHDRFTPHGSLPRKHVLNF